MSALLSPKLRQTVLLLLPIAPVVRGVSVLVAFIIGFGGGGDDDVHAFC